MEGPEKKERKRRMHLFALPPKKSFRWLNFPWPPGMLSYYKIDETAVASKVPINHDWSVSLSSSFPLKQEKSNWILLEMREIQLQPIVVVYSRPNWSMHWLLHLAQLNFPFPNWVMQTKSPSSVELWVVHMLYSWPSWVKGKSQRSLITEQTPAKKKNRNRRAF